MEGKSLYEILFDGVEPSFLYEIGFRTLFMFLLIVMMLRVSGRRGVRQLTLFEVAIILGLGSAAGDPMFQDDFPLVHAIIVFIIVITLYKLLTWLVAKYDFFTRLLEGKALVIVRDGEFAVTEENKSTFSKTEFFSELRNASIEHLGQVRIAVLETDGSLSVLRYADSEVKYGLPIFPDDYKEFEKQPTAGTPIACMYCGHVIFDQKPLECPTCNHRKFAKAMNKKYC